MGEISNLICIVDDDASVRRALGRMVRSFGFDVHLFASGRECLDCPSVAQARCLVLDVRMPHTDGFELHSLLVASGLNIPTIFISAGDDQISIDRAQSAGAQAFLHKPFDTRLLHDAIANAIEA